MPYFDTAIGETIVAAQGCSFDLASPRCELIRSLGAPSSALTFAHAVQALNRTPPAITRHEIDFEVACTALQSFNRAIAGVMGFLVQLTISPLLFARFSRHR